MPTRLPVAAAALAGLLAATTLAHAAPPPPPPGDVPPPPAPRDAPPPPPPPGAHVILDRQADGVVHVDVHCAQLETTAACAEIATRLLGPAGAAPPAK